jgi:hypothetical protein
LDTAYVVRWRAVVVNDRPALQEFEFVARHDEEPVVLARIYLGRSGTLSLDSGQLVALCAYDDPQVARRLAGLVMTGLLSSVIYAPRDRIFDPGELDERASDPDATDM